MKRFHKMVAAVMAVATLATSMVPLSADALYFNENSKFTYDLAVESESDDMIKVTFYTTYNPGTALWRTKCLKHCPRRQSISLIR